MKVRFLMLALFCVNLVLAGSLTGVVYSKSSKAALDDCKVMLLQDGKVINSTNTNFNGVFNIAFKKNKNYTFEVIKSGYKTESIQIFTDQDFIDSNPSFEVYLSALNLSPKFEKMQNGLEQKEPNPDIMEDIGDISDLPEGYKIIEAKPIKLTETKKSGFNVNMNDGNTKTNVNVEVLKEKFNQESVVQHIYSDREKFPSSYYAEGSIYYDSGKTLLTKNVKEIMDGIAAKLLNEPLTALKLVAFSDALQEVNIGDFIAKLRVEEVTKYLMDKGVQFEQIMVVIKGNTVLENGCYDGVDCGEYEHQVNRRVDLILVK